MLHFDQEPAFFLHRQPYKENGYLIDIFTLNYGFFCAHAYIPQGKTYRKTNNYAPFRLFSFSGQRKGEFASVRQVVLQYDLTPAPARLLNAHYLNEILLGLLPFDEPAPSVFIQYLHSLQQTDESALRRLEYALLAHLGLFPEITQEASFYQLDFKGNDVIFVPSASGYGKGSVEQLSSGVTDWESPEIRKLLQSLVRFHSGRRAHTKESAAALKSLLHGPSKSSLTKGKTQ